MRQPHGRQTDAVVPAIFGVTRQGIRKSGRFRPAGRGLLPGFFCPLRLRGQYQPEVTPGTIRHAGDFAAEFTGGFAVERLCAPKRSTSPVSTRYGGSGAGSTSSASGTRSHQPSTHHGPCGLFVAR
ncbi:Uncharacterised protein [Escherichia coli]|uniref:Uncharacterized protein n=1 Tax=Escherichia coli TaxID=562 RepID=A0A377B143_ECOLX|nr:Uncharacterised protein [Escherichia coli]